MDCSWSSFWILSVFVILMKGRYVLILWESLKSSFCMLVPSLTNDWRILWEFNLLDEISWPICGGYPNQQKKLVVIFINGHFCFLMLYMMLILRKTISCSSCLLRLPHLRKRIVFLNCWLLDPFFFRYIFVN